MSPFWAHTNHETAMPTVYKTKNTMKALPSFILLPTAIFANAQTLPINFETTILTAVFINFDGGTATVINNPQPNGINTSATVARISQEWRRGLGWQ